MLTQAKISLTCLFIYAGFTVGFGLLVLAVFFDDGFGRWGIAVLCLSCTFSVHRAIAVRDELLTAAFKLGVARGQERALSSIR